MKKIYSLILFLIFSGSIWAQVNTLTESFDAASPAGWTATNKSSPLGTRNWTSGAALAELPGFIGGGHAYVNYASTTGGTGTISNWYISPQVNLVDGASISFYTTTSTGAPYADRLEVRLSTSGASTNVGTTATDVGDFTITACTINPSLQAGPGTGCGDKYPDTWTHIVITVSGVGSTPVAGRIAFRYFVTNGGPSGANSNLIGIDEFSYDNTTCSTPVAGTASAPASACNNTNFSLTLTGSSPGSALIQWQSSPVGANTWTNVSGATSPISSISQTGPRDYRASVTCPGGGSPQYSNTVTVSQNTSTCPPSCTSNIAPANNATNVTYQPAINVSWTAASGATSYDFYIGTTTSPSFLQNFTGTNVTLSGASPNTTYYWYVVPKNANGTLNNCSSTMTSFTTGAAAPAPANDDCGGAIALNAYMGATGYSGTSVSATPSASIPSCGVSTTWGTPDTDVWYKFTAAHNGDATITVVGTGGFDGVLQVFSGTCGSLVQIGSCKDATGGSGTETLTATSLTAGQTYYLRVYDWNGAEGNFSIVLSGTALPVTITDFTGHVEGSTNVLGWTTATEINNKGFDLERSADGKNFTTISKIASKAPDGNSNSVLNYSFVDHNPLSGTNYYRLKQIDNDGKFSLSNIVLLKSKVTQITLSSVYPNPAKTQLNVIITSPSSEKVTIVVSDLSGKTVLQQSTQMAVGDNLQQLDVQKLSSGTYLVKVICSSGCETAIQRFVKN